MNLAESLWNYTTVVADNGDIEAMHVIVRRTPQLTPLFSITRHKCLRTGILSRRSDPLFVAGRRLACSSPRSLRSPFECSDDGMRCYACSPTDSNPANPFARFIPNFRILFCRVVRLSPRRSAAPLLPAILPEAARSALMITPRSACWNVEIKSSRATRL